VRLPQFWFFADGTPTTRTPMMMMMREVAGLYDARQDRLFDTPSEAPAEDERAEDDRGGHEEQQEERREEREPVVF